MNDDVFDDDLIKELGLDPDDLKEPQKPLPVPKTAPREVKESSKIPDSRPALAHKPLVTVSAVLAQKKVSLNEIQNFVAGHVFALDVPQEKLVELYVGDKQIGKGELVLFDDRLAVRLLEVCE